MKLSLSSNISSLKAQRSLGRSSETLAGVSSRLSSGQRITGAADDPAGLAISMSLRAGDRVNSQAIRNLSDGISLLNIADGALQQMQEVIFRQKELAAQAANGVYGLQQKKAINAESDALIQEFNRIAETTRFNGMNILDNGLNGITLQGGAGTDAVFSLNIGQAISNVVSSGTFTATATFNAPRVTDVNVVDYNKDGHLDVFAALYFASAAYVLPGGPQGTFGTPMSFVIAQTGVGGGTHDLELGDLNGDNLLDIVASNHNANTVTIATGRADGTFNPATTIAIGQPRSSIIADFNNDGFQDIATAGTSLRLLMGNGDGTFRTGVSYGPANSQDSITSEDVNGDGVRDIIAASVAANRISVFLGNSDGTFKNPSLYTSPGVRSVTAADMNRDGVIDLVYATATQNTVSIRMGNGNGTFQAAVSMAAGTDPRGIAIADFNEDGFQDMMVSADLTTSLFLGNGDGTFLEPVTRSVAGKPESIAVGDFNKDGALDAVMGAYGVPDLMIFTSTPLLTPNMPLLNLTSQKSARESMDRLDKSLEQLATGRGAIGASLSRITTGLRVIETQREAERAAESRIADADIAQETATLSRLQILQQGAAAVLAQANQTPSIALSLLQ